MGGTDITSDRTSASSTDASQHERLGQLLDQALELPPEQRDAFVAEVCGADVALRQELISLLEAHEAAGDLDDLSANLVMPALTAISRAANDTVNPATIEELQQNLTGQYRIERELGGAGMSRVFVAEEVRLKRRVVIKVLRPEMVPTANALRFQHEIALAAQLQHPHIVPLLTTDTANGTLYYTMPFVTGESLRERLARGGVLPMEDALRIWRDLLDALAHAHASGVIHCDIKPGNILLSGRNALVTDFGIALAIETAGADTSATTHGPVIGTPAYMAPEQIRGGAAVDHRVDLYATGVVMYETLMGHTPFTGVSTRELLEARGKRDPLPLQRADVPEELAALVMSCLAEDPAARPQSAEALLAALDASVANEAINTRPPISLRRRVSPMVFASLGVAAVLFAASRLPLGHRAAAAPPSLAVWPLASLNSSPEDSALAAGMTQELTGMLGRNGKVRVVASSMRDWQAQRINLDEMRQRLNVSYILEGVVQKNGSRLHLQLRLVDVRDGSIRSAKTYDREMGDIVAVLDDVARLVADALDVQLAGGNRHPAALRYTPKADAFEWYLRGMDLSVGAANGRREQAIEYFKRAIAADPNFAAAYAGLAHRYVASGGSRPLAEQTALKAVALDDSLGHAHSALGWVRLARGQWDSAEVELKQAIALDPFAPRALEGLARIYMFMEQPIQQLTYARVGSALYPGSVSATRELALAHMNNGECDKALELLRPLKEMDPPAGVAGVIRGQCYAAERKWPEAIAEFRWSLEHTDADAALAMLGYALARAGQRDDAMRILSDLLTGRKDSWGKFGIATVYTGLGDYDNAFAYLDKAVDEGKLRPYIMGPMFEELQQDSRFQGFKKRLGL